MLNAQSYSNYPAYQITKLNGLAQNSVNFITQDGDGFIWYGTQTSLERFDGDPDRLAQWYISEFKSNGYARSILTLEDGVLIGTHTGALLKLKNRFSDAKHSELIKIKDSLGDIIRIGTIEDKCIVISKGGIFLFKAFEKDRFELIKSISLKIECALIDHTDIYVGTKEKLIRYKISPASLDSVTEIAHVHSYPQSFAIAGETLWMGLKNGYIRRYDLRKSAFIKEDIHCTNNISVTALLILKTGLIWAGTDGDGIHVFNNSTLREDVAIRREQGLSSNLIISLFESSDSTIFIGTSGGGMCVFHARPMFRHLFNYENKGNNFLWSLYYVNDKYLLAGTKGSGLRIVDINNGDALEVKNNNNNNIQNYTVNAIEKAGGDYFIGTDSGLYRIKLKWLPSPGYTVNPLDIFKAETENKRITKLLYDQADDQLFIGNGADSNITFVQRLRNNTVVSRYKVKGANINAIVKTKDKKNLLVGTESGIDRFTFKNDSLDRKDKLLKDKVIMNLLTVGDTLYAATRNGEIYRISLKNFVTIDSIIGKPSKESGGTFPRSALYGLLKDNRHIIWISSNVGLFRFRPENGKFDHYKDINITKQLEFNRGAFCSATDSTHLYFGGPDGIIEVDAANIAGENFSHRVSFIEISYYLKDRKDVIIQKGDEPVRLPNDVDYFEIRPIYLCFNELHNHYVSYELENDSILSGANPISQNMLFQGNLVRQFLNWLGLPVCFRVSLNIQEGLNNYDHDPVIIKVKFDGNIPLFIFYMLIFITVIYTLSWFFKRTKQKNRLVESINKTTSTYSSSNLLKVTIDQLIDKFKFHYVIISLIDYKHKKITSVKHRAADEVKLFFGLHTQKNPIKAYIGEWVSRSEYSLKDNDILCKMLNTGQPVCYAGRFSDQKGFVKKDLNPEIYTKYGHASLSRYFIPMVDRSNVLGEIGDGDHSFEVGVVEVGYKINPVERLRYWLRLLIQYKPLKYDLKLLTDNFSQVYLQSFLREEKEKIASEIKKISERVKKSDDFLKHVLALFVEYTDSKYAKIDILTFNQADFDLKEAFIAYGFKDPEFYALLDQSEDYNDKQKTGISRHVFNTKGVYICDNTTAVEEKFYIKVFEEIKSEMGVPIFYGGELVSVLILSSATQNAYSAVQARIIKDVIDDAWSIAMSKRRVMALEKIASPNYNIAADSTDMIYYPVVEALGDYFHSNFISVWEKIPLSDESFELSIPATSQAFYEMYEKSNLTTKGITKIQHAENDDIVSIIQVSSQQDRSIDEFSEHYGFKQYIVIRIVFEGRYEGFINIFAKRAITITTDDDIFLTQISNYVSASIIANKLFQAFRDLSRSFDKGKEMYQKLVNHAKELSRADLVSFFPLVNEQYAFKEGIHSPLAEPIKFEDAKDKANLPRAILEIGHQYISNEQHYIAIIEERLGRKLNQEDIERTFWRRFGNRSVAAIRLTLDDKKLGVIFFNYKTPKDFTTGNSPTKEIIETFSNFAKILILNFSIVEKIQEETSKLQTERQSRERSMRDYQKMIHENQKKIEDLVKITDRYRDLVVARSFYSMVDGLLHECKNYLFLLIDKLKKMEKENWGLDLEIKSVRSYAQSVEKILNIFNINTDQVESLDIVDIIKSITAFFKSFGDHTDVQFEVTDDKKITMTGNRTEVALIFHNLIANSMAAISKSKADKPHFHAKIDVTFEDQANQLLVKVHDNGGGIDAKYLPEAIFERGFTTKRDPETNETTGTGIGLSYVKEILEERYAGTITCQSRVGIGTTFFVTFAKHKIR